jgi:glycosyltransferase involved in cell wall biosynthesis
VIIPTIPPRRRQLERAVNSVRAQDYQGKVEILIALDADKLGSAKTRNRALARADTPWVAFLDDDDYLLPQHLRVLMDAAYNPENHQPDIIYPGCTVLGPNGVEIPRQEEWGRYTRPFEPGLFRAESYVPVTSLVLRKVAQKAWFGPPDHDPTSKYDDWGFYLRALDAGAIFHHHVEVTWIWIHDGANTSGEVTRW